MYAKRMTSELARLSVMIGFLSSFETVKDPIPTNENMKYPQGNVLYYVLSFSLRESPTLQG